MMGMLNNREVSLLFWGALIVVWALSAKEVRQSVPGILRILLFSKLTFVFALIAAYSALALNLLSVVASSTVLKEAVFWILFSGVSYATNSLTDVNHPVLSSNHLLRFLTGVAVVEFLVASVTFGLIVELLLVPSVVLLAMLDLVARRKERFKGVANVTSALLMAVGLILFGSATYTGITEFSEVATLESLLTFLVPVLMYLSFAPLAFTLKIESGYEIVFSRLDFVLEADPKTRRYAK